MPYAINDRISKAPLDGGVEISDQEYIEARNHLISGKLIKTHNDKLILTEKPKQLDDHKEPVWKDGDWYHEAIEKEPETTEQLEEKVKNKRDELLKQTDYLVMPDYPSKPRGIKVYRQALRDITKQEGYPEDVEWPVNPLEKK